VGRGAIEPESAVPDTIGWYTKISLEEQKETSITNKIGAGKGGRGGKGEGGRYPRS